MVVPLFIVTSAACVGNALIGTAQSAPSRSWRPRIFSFSEFEDTSSGVRYGKLQILRVYNYECRWETCEGETKKRNTIRPLVCLQPPSDFLIFWHSYLLSKDLLEPYSNSNKNEFSNKSIMVQINFQDLWSQH